MTRSASQIKIALVLGLVGILLIVVSVHTLFVSDVPHGPRFLGNNFVTAAVWVSIALPGLIMLAVWNWDWLPRRWPQQVHRLRQNLMAPLLVGAVLFVLLVGAALMRASAVGIRPTEIPTRLDVFGFYLTLAAGGTLYSVALWYYRCWSSRRGQSN